MVIHIAELANIAGIAVQAPTIMRHSSCQGVVTQLSKTRKSIYLTTSQSFPAQTVNASGCLELSCASTG